MEEQGLGWMEPAFLKALQSRDASFQPWEQETLTALGNRIWGEVSCGKRQRVPSGSSEETPEWCLVPWEMQC